MISRRGFISSSSVLPFVSGQFFSGHVFAQDSADLGPLRRQAVRLRVHLRHANLYAFQVVA